MFGRLRKTFGKFRGEAKKAGAENDEGISISDLADQRPGTIGMGQANLVKLVDRQVKKNLAIIKGKGEALVNLHEGIEEHMEEALKKFSNSKGFITSGVDEVKGFNVDFDGKRMPLITVYSALGRGLSDFASFLRKIKVELAKGMHGEFLRFAAEEKELGSRMKELMALLDQSKMVAKIGNDISQDVLSMKVVVGKGEGTQLGAIHDKLMRDLEALESEITLVSEKIETVRSFVTDEMPRYIRDEYKFDIRVRKLLNAIQKEKNILGDAMNHQLSLILKNWQSVEKSVQTFIDEIKKKERLANDNNLSAGNDFKDIFEEISRELDDLRDIREAEEKLRTA